jgi:hypothetical protein
MRQYEYAMLMLNKSQRENEARVGRSSGKRSIAGEIPQPQKPGDREAPGPITKVNVAQIIKGQNSPLRGVDIAEVRGLALPNLRL